MTQIFKIQSEIWVVSPTPEIWRPKNALQTTNTTAQANLIRRTLVHKRRKIGPEFRPTQRVAITLGIATHLVETDPGLSKLSQINYIGVFFDSQCTSSASSPLLKLSIKRSGEHELVL